MFQMGKMYLLRGPATVSEDSSETHRAARTPCRWRQEGIALLPARKRHVARLLPKKIRTEAPAPRHLPNDFAGNGTSFAPHFILSIILAPCALGKKEETEHEGHWLFVLL